MRVRVGLGIRFRFWVRLGVRVRFRFWVRFRVRFRVWVRDRVIAARLEARALCRA